MKKYKLLKENAIRIEGTGIASRLLYRVRYLRNFADIKKGDLGGYIEKEENLSHDGNARVCDNAWVFSDARVSGDARVHDDARVYGNARVYGEVCGNARVFGDAEVGNGAQVSGDSRVYGKARILGRSQVRGDTHVNGDTWMRNNVESNELSRYLGVGLLLMSLILIIGFILLIPLL